jgi:hypothetical protein
MTALPGSVPYAIGQGQGQVFTALEVDVYRPGSGSASLGLASGEAPHASTPGAASAASDSSVVRASDLGYVSRTTDSIGLQVYPPTLAEGFASNRQLDLTPGGQGAAVSWGELKLLSDDRRYDSGLLGRNADQRAVSVLIGLKTMDVSRGLYVDPAYADLAPLFTGLAQAWQTFEGGLTLPVRDYGAWLERPYLDAAYAGTGTTEGTADILGRLKPKLRGGNSSDPVRNCAPVLIDPTNNIWQLSDGPIGIVSLYERGAAVFSYSGDVGNLWSGSVAAGAYRTDNANGMFQLGSPAAGQITCDAHGEFPAGGVDPHDTAGYAAWRLLSGDAALPGGTLDAASFSGMDSGAAYKVGWYWDGSTQEDCATAAGRFLAAANARIITRRDGTIACVPLRAVATGATPDGVYDGSQIVSCTRIALPATVSPPLYRLRWGYQHNHTVISSDINPTVTDARRQFLINADRYVAQSSATVLAAYRRPNDLDPVPSALLKALDAAAIAGLVMLLWATERRLYSVELPVALALRHEIGDTLQITWPMDNLDAGQTGLIVGEQLRMQDATSHFQVLV